jgi:hypothetical protein
MKSRDFRLSSRRSEFGTERLTIDNRHKENLSTPEAEKIYSSAGSVVERELDIKHSLHPQVRLFNFRKESVSCDGDTATHRGICES